VLAVAASDDPLEGPPLGHQMHRRYRNIAGAPAQVGVVDRVGKPGSAAQGTGEGEPQGLELREIRPDSCHRSLLDEGGPTRRGFAEEPPALEIFRLGAQGLDESVDPAMDPAPHTGSDEGFTAPGRLPGGQALDQGTDIEHRWPPIESRFARTGFRKWPRAQVAGASRASMVGDSASELLHTL